MKPRNPSMVRLTDLHRTYSLGSLPVHAVKGVNLDIAEGEFTAIMGASGSGKSTLMNILGCLDCPTQGSYFLDQQDVSKLSRDQLAGIRNHKLGFVFQNFNLLSRTSALENVELPMLYSKGSPHLHEMKAKALRMLDIVGLAGREKHYSSQLSGGQQQRVALARALINDPKILLADEPTGNLDSQTSVEIMGLFQRLNAEGLTIIMVTHEPDIASYARRIIVMRDGEVVSDEANPIVLNPSQEFPSTS